MTALAGTVPLAQPHRVPVAVGEHLHLDVAGPAEIALDIDLAVPEGGLSLTPGRFQGGGDIGGAGDDLDSATTTAKRRLDRDRPAVGVAEGDDLGEVGNRLTPARDAGDACTLGSEPSTDLVAHGLDRTGRRSYEGRTGGGDRPSERRALGEEPVPRMHRVGTAARQGVQDGFGREVALGRGLATQGVCLVGETDMERVAVQLGVDSDRRDPELAAGSDDPHGDLAAVGHEHLVEHGPPSST